jgi:hypothetical protein
VLKAHGGRPAAALETGKAEWSRRLNHPVVTAVAALAAALVFVAARLVFGTSGDITQFIVVGAHNLAGHGLPPGIHIFPGTGYDGQFYYRQALDPFNTALIAHGIRLDGFYRLQRLGYPLLAWLAALGRQGLVPDSLVAVNLVGTFVLGLLGGVIARDAGRHALYGLLLSGYFGLVTTLARDLTEIVEVSLLLAAVLAYRRGRYLLTGLAFAGAVVTKETEVFVVLAYAVVVGLDLLRRKAGLRAQLVWVLPGLAFTGVQLWLYESTHHLAGQSGAQGNFATPLTAPLHALSTYIRHPFDLANAIWLGELAVLTIVVVVALLTLLRTTAWRTTALVPERVAFVFLIGLALSLSGEVWNGQADFRSLAPLFEMAGVVLIGSRLRLWLLCAIAAVAYLVAYVHRVRFT